MSLALRKNETKKTYTQDYPGKHIVMCGWIDCLPVHRAVFSSADASIVAAAREKEHEYGQPF